MPAILETILTAITFLLLWPVISFMTICPDYINTPWMFLAMLINVVWIIFIMHLGD